MKLGGYLRLDGVISEALGPRPDSFRPESFPWGAPPTVLVRALAWGGRAGLARHCGTRQRCPAPRGLPARLLIGIALRPCMPAHLRCQWTRTP